MSLAKTTSLCLFAVVAVNAQNFTISTIAGGKAFSPGEAITDYAVSEATAVAEDASGNVYFNVGPPVRFWWRMPPER